MMYHKNRLIKAYCRVGCQLKVGSFLNDIYVYISLFFGLTNLHLLQTNYKGVGVIGIIECNFLDPTHNKQSFNESDKYKYGHLHFLC